MITAFAKRDSKLILKSVTDEIRWNVVGDTVIERKDSLGQTLESLKEHQAIELHIHHIATHGKAGAVDGMLLFKDGRRRVFCDVYAFSNAKGTSVQEITSYVIELKSIPVRREPGVGNPCFDP